MKLYLMALAALSTAEDTQSAAESTPVTTQVLNTEDPQAEKTEEKPEEPKAAEPQTEEPKAAEPQTEEPKAETEPEVKQDAGVEAAGNAGEEAGKETQEAPKEAGKPEGVKVEGVKEVGAKKTTVKTKKTVETKTVKLLAPKDQMKLAVQKLAGGVKDPKVQAQYMKCAQKFAFSAQAQKGGANFVCVSKAGECKMGDCLESAKNPTHPRVSAKSILDFTAIQQQGDCAKACGGRCTRNNLKLMVSSAGDLAYAVKPSAELGYCDMNKKCSNSPDGKCLEISQMATVIKALNFKAVPNVLSSDDFYAMSEMLTKAKNNTSVVSLVNLDKQFALVNGSIAHAIQLSYRDGIPVANVQNVKLNGQDVKLGLWFPTNQNLALVRSMKVEEVCAGGGKLGCKTTQKAASNCTALNFEKLFDLAQGVSCAPVENYTLENPQVQKLYVALSKTMEENVKGFKMDGKVYPYALFQKSEENLLQTLSVEEKVKKTEKTVKKTKTVETSVKNKVQTSRLLQEEAEPEADEKEEVKENAEENAEGGEQAAEVKAEDKDVESLQQAESGLVPKEKNTAETVTQKADAAKNADVPKKGSEAKPKTLSAGSPRPEAKVKTVKNASAAGKPSQTLSAAYHIKLNNQLYGLFNSVAHYKSMDRIALEVGNKRQLLAPFNSTIVTQLFTNVAAEKVELPAEKQLLILADWLKVEPVMKAGNMSAFRLSAKPAKANGTTLLLSSSAQPRLFFKIANAESAKERMQKLENSRACASVYPQQNLRLAYQTPLGLYAMPQKVVNVNNNGSGEWSKLGEALYDGLDFGNMAIGRVQLQPGCKLELPTPKMQAVPYTYTYSMDVKTQFSPLLSITTPAKVTGFGMKMQQAPQQYKCGCQSLYSQYLDKMKQRFNQQLTAYQNLKVPASKDCALWMMGSASNTGLKISSDGFQTNYVTLKPFAYTQYNVKVNSFDDKLQIETIGLQNGQQSLYAYSPCFKTMKLKSKPSEYTKLLAKSQYVNASAEPVKLSVTLKQMSPKATLQAVYFQQSYLGDEEEELAEAADEEDEAEVGGAAAMAAFLLFLV